MFSRLLFEDPKHATVLHIKKMLNKHNRETKVLDRGVERSRAISRLVKLARAASGA